jgi:hypothetical protein
MVFKRVFMPMLVLGIMLGLSSMAYAQTVTCTLSAPTGSTGATTATGHTEPIAAGTTGVPPTAAGGTLRVTCVEPAGGGDAPTSVGTLTINLGVPITNSATTTATNGHPPGFGVRVVDGTGAFLAGVPYVAGQNVGISSISNTNGTIVIGLGTPGATSGTGAVNPTAGITFADGTTSTFDIEGVLIGLNGSGKATVDAVMGIVGGAGYIVGAANSVRVVETVQAGLKDPTVPTGTLPAAAVIGGVTAGGPASLNSAGVAIKGNFTVRIEEGYLSMFKDNSQFNGGGGGIFPASGGSDTQVNLVFSGVPAGLTISGCSAVLTDAAGAIGTAGSPTLSAAAVTNLAPVLTVNFNAAVDQLAIDVLWVTCTTVAVGTATVPLPTTDVTVKATLAPTGSALTGMGGAQTGLTTGQIPRYQEALLPAAALTVVSFPPAATTLLVPFAAVGGTFNTGIAIANASTAPTGGALQSGTITFTMYKNDGTSRTYTTAAGSPGAGLNASGVLGTGGTYTVNVSELLSAAGFGSTFLGYIYINTNFTAAHAAATIYVTSSGAATLSTPVLVVSGAGFGQ